MPQLANMFKFRHQRTLHDLQLRQQTRTPLHVGVSGASGLMGRELCQTLDIAGHRATRLLRYPPNQNSDAAAIVAWHQQTDSTTTPLPAASQQALEQLDAVVHLAGMPIAQRRWNAATKREIRDSRVDLTHQLCRQLATLKSPPQTLICASATGIYGDREDEVLTEASRAGQGFLASVAEEWESACRPAVEAGIRVVHARFGIVLSARGGALQRTLLPAKLCGGHLGHGHQWWSWIAIDDAVRAILHLLTNTQVSGPVNMVSPEAVQQREFARTLGKVLGRPALLPAPRFALRLALGEMADELLLTSTRVAPEALQDSGYRFLFPELESALRFQTGRFERAAS